MDCLYHPRTFRTWTVRTVDCSYPPGLFIPWTICTITGLFVPCWERRHSLYSASQTPPLWGFLIFFQNGWEFLVQILHAYYTFLPIVDYKFFFSYLQLWRSNAIKCRLIYRSCSSRYCRFALPRINVEKVGWKQEIVVLSGRSTESEQTPVQCSVVGDSILDCRV